MVTVRRFDRRDARKGSDEGDRRRSWYRHTGYAVCGGYYSGYAVGGGYYSGYAVGGGYYPLRSPDV